jgi:hypothetical protein
VAEKQFSSYHLVPVAPTYNNRSTSFSDPQLSTTHPIPHSIRLSSQDARSLEEGERKEKFHPNGSNDAHVLNDLHGGHVDPYIADPEHMNEAGKWSDGNL